MKILTAEEQENIIQTTPVEFEQLALLWRNYTPEGAKPDLGKAVLKMICAHYFSEDSLSPPGGLARIICCLLTKPCEKCGVDPLEEISNRIREELKKLIPGPDPSIIGDPIGISWLWVMDWWCWCLSLHDAKERIPRGEVRIIPLKNGRAGPITPEAYHDQWAIEIHIPFKDEKNAPWPIGYVLLRISRSGLIIPLKGSLDQVKHQLDLLLGVNTPPLPEATEFSVPPPEGSGPLA